jgi:hypothetical protein
MENDGHLLILYMIYDDLYTLKQMYVSVATAHNQKVSWEYNG